MTPAGPSSSASSDDPSLPDKLKEPVLKYEPDQDAHRPQQSVAARPGLVSRSSTVQHNSGPMVKRTKTFVATGSQFREVRDRLHQHLLHPVMSRLHKESTKQPAHPQRGSEGGPQRGRVVPISVVDIMKKLHPQDGRRFPEFDSLGEHALQEASSRELHLREVKRLVSIAAKPTCMPRLTSTLLLENTLRGNTAEDYYEVSRMSQSISTALTLCELENECINVIYCPILANQKRLQRQVQQAMAASGMSDKQDNEEAKKGVRYDNDSRQRALLALVDYISAIVAHLISQTADGDYWIINMLAVLVAQTTKMKVFLTDLEGAAATAASIGSEALERSGSAGTEAATEISEEEECEEALRLIDAKMQDGLASDLETQVSNYCVNQNQFRSGLNSVIKNVLLSLRFLNRSGLPPTSYEICAVVYEIGFEGFMTALFQDRDLEYAASSDRQVLNTAQAAFIMVDGILSKLKSSFEEMPLLPGAATTFVEWYYNDRHGVPSCPPSPQHGQSAAGMHNNAYNQLCVRKINLRHMSDILSVTIPLSTTNAMVLSNLTSFRTMMALSGGVQDLVTPFADGRFDAFIRLCTGEFDLEDRNRGILRMSTALWESQFSRCRLLADGNWGTDTLGRGSSWGSSWRVRLGLAKTKAVSEDVAPNDKQDLVLPGYDEIQRHLDQCAAEMDSWVLDETSVTVSCSWYVWSVTAAALLLTGGGLAVGFSVGQHIKGVDPFNLANYTWVAAALFLLICKSMLVRQWEWSDFLRRRVRCYSVSELANTTGLHEQLIIAKLLHQDCGKGTSSSTILTTRGPYNLLFRRQADSSSGDGFSIDCPIRPSTMMLSGIVLLKVLTPKGDAIVCLDCRRGTECVTLMHRADRNAERLVCEDLTPLMNGDGDGNGNGEGPGSLYRAVSNKAKAIGDDDDKALTHLRLTKTKKCTWKRMQGLYKFTNGDVVFV